MVGVANLVLAVIAPWHCALPGKALHPVCIDALLNGRVKCRVARRGGSVSLGHQSCSSGHLVGDMEQGWRGTAFGVDVLVVASLDDGSAADDSARLQLVSA